MSVTNTSDIPNWGSSDPADFTTNNPSNATTDKDAGILIQRPMVFPFALWHQIITVVVISLIGLVGNGLVILIYGKKLMSEKTGSNLLIVVLGFVDLLATTVCLPLELMSGRRVLSMAMYMMYGVLVAFVLLGSLNLLLAMSIDRFIALYKPMQYRYGYRRTKYALVFLFIWVMAVSTAFLYMKAFRELGTAATYIPISVTVLVYAVIFWGLYVRNRNKVGGSNLTPSAQQPGVTMSVTSPTELTACPKFPASSIDNQTVGHTETRAVLSVTNGTQSTSSAVAGTQSNVASTESKRRLARTAKMFLTITVVFILAYIPYNLYNYNIIRFPRSNVYRHTYYLNSISNFFIYAFFNKSFRKSVRNFLKTGQNHM